MSRFVRSLSVLCLALWAAPAVLAQGPPPPPPQVPPPPEPADEFQGVAYLVISLDDTFVYDDGEDAPDSQTIIVPLGLFAANTSVEDATFTPEDAVFVPLPPGINVQDLVGNPTTIVGTFGLTNDEEEFEVHLVNGSADGVDDDVEMAIYNATRGANEDGMTFADLFRSADGESQNPTTGDIVSFIAGFAGEGVTEDEIAEALFAPADTLSQPSDVSPTIEAEGDLFPHDDDYYYCSECCSDCCYGKCNEPPAPIFQFAFLVNNQGSFDLALCNEIIDVEIDIKSTINLKKKGLLPVHLFGSADLDVEDIVPGTTRLGGVLAAKEKVQDLNGDGYDDLLLHFDVPDLVAGGFLNASTVSLTLVAELEGDTDVCVRGSDTVSLTPSSKK